MCTKSLLSACTITLLTFMWLVRIFFVKLENGCVVVFVLRVRIKYIIILSTKCQFRALKAHKKCKKNYNYLV